MGDLSTRLPQQTKDEMLSYVLRLLKESQQTCGLELADVFHIAETTIKYFESDGDVFYIHFGNMLNAYIVVKVSWIETVDVDVFVSEARTLPELQKLLWFAEHDNDEQSKPLYNLRFQTREGLYFTIRNLHGLAR